ncbi:FapA family protein, partial [Patescibacteria group bacterium]|nr:FapA family protein [Patescibacteria group bacterium]
MKKAFSALSSILMLAVLSCVSIQTVFAAEFVANEEVYLSDIMLDDTYIAGGLVTITEDISGDLVVTGGNITIDGNVEGDLLVAGGQITVNGDVSDDIRIAGGSIYVNGNIGDDLISMGGQLQVGKNSLIGGSVVIGTGFANILGTVNEDIIGGGGRVIIGGTVYRDINLQVQDVLTLTKDAKVNGNLIYTSLREAELEETQVAGYIEFNKQMPIDDTNIGEKVET